MAEKCYTAGRQMVSKGQICESIQLFHSSLVGAPPAILLLRYEEVNPAKSV